MLSASLNQIFPSFLIADTVRVMSGLCAGYVRAMCRLCAGYVQVMCGLCAGYERAMCGIERANRTCRSDKPSMYGPAAV